MITVREQVLCNDQICLILGLDYILTLQDGDKDVFDPIRERLKSAKGKARKSTPDYLLYLLIDSIIDHYFLVLDYYSEKLESLDMQSEELSREKFAELQQIKRKVVLMRRSIAPVRDLISSLLKFQSHLIKDQHIPYFRDLHDHAVQVLDLVDLQRDILNDISNTHLSMMAHKTNDVMRILTVISTIFMPLTFLVGVYGMNFKFMPELDWQYGYLIVWILMAFIVLVMLRYFREKKWL